MATTRVYFIVDQSSSMWAFTPSIVDILHGMHKSNDATDTGMIYHYIVFSDTATDGTDISKMTRMCGNTNIGPAFKKLHDLVTMANPMPEKVVVVFISDGEDNNPQLCTARLQNLGRLPVPSILLTVGINQNFPTGFVVDILRPLYHQGSLALNPVIPVHSVDDLDWAFAQLEGLIATKGEPIDIPDEISLETPSKDIVNYIKAIYNESVVTCAKSGRSPKENYETLFECKSSISLANDILAKKVATEKTSGPKPKPLASTILSNKFNNTSKALTTSFEFIAKLNKMITETQKGILISELSDAAKQELIGYSNRAGKLITVASKYKGANFNTTKESIMRLLRHYTPTEADEELIDPINMCSQAEYFQDAAKVYLELIPHLHTLPGVLSLVSFIGRTITWKERRPIDALQMNPWLCDVESLPVIHSLMTTLDFFETFHGKFEARDEKVTGLMILGGHATSPGIFKHVSSYLLTENIALYHHDSREATAASVLLHLLSEHKLNDWVKNELEIIKSVCTWSMLNNAQWNEYIECVAEVDNANEYRKCLVSQSADLKSSFTCPGLTKFILALWINIYMKKRQFSVEQLTDRYIAFVFEFLGRYNAQNVRGGGFTLQECFDYSINVTPMAFLSKFPQLFSIVKESTHTSQAQSEFNRFLEISWPFVKFEDVMSELIYNPTRIENIVYNQFSMQTIRNTFQMLAVLCGYPEETTFELSPTQALNLVIKSTEGHSSIERSKMDLTTPLDLQHYKIETQHKILRIFKRATSDMAPELIKEVFLTRATKQHKGMARVIPKAHMQRFKEEFDLDIEADWCVNAQGLSMTACCAPECDHYLKRLVIGNFTGIPPALSLHLNSTGGYIHGFHKCVAKNVDKDVSEIIEKIQNGACLETPLRGDAVQIPPNSTPDMAESLRSYSEYKAKLLEGVWDGIVKGVKTNIKTSASRLKMDEYDFMKQEVKNLKEEFLETKWDYEDFKKTFLNLYDTPKKKLISFEEFEASD